MERVGSYGLVRNIKGTIFDKNGLTVITRYGMLIASMKELKNGCRRIIVEFSRRLREQYKTNVKEEVKDMKKVIFIAAVLTVVAFAFGAMAQQKTTPPPAKPAPAADVWLPCAVEQRRATALQRYSDLPARRAELGMVPGDSLPRAGRSDDSR